jgi:hypothetical protein
MVCPFNRRPHIRAQACWVTAGALPNTEPFVVTFMFISLVLLG